MIRTCYFEDNCPVQVGIMGASPDGDGFEAIFENFEAKQLPDLRRLEWAKNSNKHTLHITTRQLYVLIELASNLSLVDDIKIQESYVHALHQVLSSFQVKLSGRHRYKMQS